MNVFLKFEVSELNNISILFQIQWKLFKYGFVLGDPKKAKHG